MRYFFVLLILLFAPVLLIGQDAMDDIQQAVDQEVFEAKDFQLEYYQKSTLEWQQIPFEVKGISARFFPSKNELGVSNIEERIGRVKRESGEIIEIVDSISTAGSLENFQWLEQSDFLINIAQNNIEISELAISAFESPLKKENLDGYKYTKCSKGWICFRPTQKQDQRFHGRIKWNSVGDYTVILKAEKSDGLNLSDSIELELTYLKRIPQKVTFKAYLSSIGFRAIYSSQSWYNNLEQEDPFEGLPPSCILLWGQNKDTVFPVDAERPVKLNADEMAVIKEQVHYDEIKQSQSFQDSVQLYNREVLFTRGLLTGDQYRLRNDDRLVLKPLWNGLGINTVEGAYFVSRPQYIHEWETSKLRWTNSFRFAFTENRFRWKTGIQYEDLSLNPYTILLESGRYISQFNDSEPIDPFWNSVYTVFSGNNFLKIYERDFIRLDAKFEPLVGLVTQAKLEIANRSALFNAPGFQGERDYTPNNPNYTGVISEEDGFRAHDALTLTLDFSYQLGQKFKVVRGRRIDIPSNLPKIYTTFRKGLKLNENSTDFDFLMIGGVTETDWGIWGFSKADLSLGGFININRVEFIDFQHFNGEQTIFLQGNSDQWSSIRQFGTLPYYSFSTSRFFTEFHVEHDFRGKLWKDVPYIGHLNWSVISGLNYLYTEEYGSFAELFIGIDRIFDLARVQWIIPIPSLVDGRFPLRFGLTIQYDYYWRNRRH